MVFSAVVAAMDWAATQSHFHSHAHPDPHGHPHLAGPEVMDWTPTVQCATSDIVMSDGPDAVDELADCIAAIYLSEVEMADLMDPITALTVDMENVRL